MSFCPEVEAQLVCICAMSVEARDKALVNRKKIMKDALARTRCFEQLVPRTKIGAATSWADIQTNTAAVSYYSRNILQVDRDLAIQRYESQAHALYLHQLATGTPVLREAAPYCPCECLCVANRQRLKHLLAANTCPFRGCGESDGSAMHWQAHIDAGDLLDKQLLITAHMTRAPPVNEAAAKRRRVTVTDAEVAESLAQLNEAQV
jgi:hypothetical protein